MKNKTIYTILTILCIVLLATLIIACCVDLTQDCIMSRICILTLEIVPATVIYVIVSLSDNIN